MRTFSPPYAERRATRARREARYTSPAQRRAFHSTLVGLAGCAVGAAAVAVIAFADLGPPDANVPYGAPARPAPISFTCGAYDVTYQPHDDASRDDVWQAAPRGCTLVANPDFRAGR